MQQSPENVKNTLSIGGQKDGRTVRSVLRVKESRARDQKEIFWKFTKYDHVKDPLYSFFLQYSFIIYNRRTKRLALILWKSFISDEEIIHEVGHQIFVTKGPFLVRDNRVLNGPLSRLLRSFAHSLRSLPRGTVEILENVFTRDVEAIDRFQFGGWDSY